MKALAKLKTVYNTKTITAGNAPGLNDGATAILLMTRQKATELGLKPLATIVTNVHFAMNASRMPEAPGLRYADGPQESRTDPG